METYIIKTDCIERKDQTSIKASEYLDSRICTDNYFNQYGFPINALDKNVYDAHLTVWNDIVNRPDSIYLIISEKVILKESLKSIQEYFNDFSEEWDVTFPYNKITKEVRINSPLLFTSKFGVYWGAYFYVVKTSGCKKLIERSERKLPVDEEILDLSFKNQIDAFFIDTKWFEYNDHECPVFLSRKKDIKNAIFNNFAFSESEKLTAVRIMSYLSLAAISNGFSLFLHAGTLLGAIRHNSIMPWDDDIDLMMTDTEVHSFVELLRKDGTYNVTEHTWKKTGLPYYKIWQTEGQYVDGYNYSFPFVDIWILYSNADSSMYTTDGYKFERQTYFPLKPTIFEGCELKLPAIPFNILDEMYSGWKELLKVYTWCHKLKNHSFKGLQLPIEVDDTGRHINS